ncbi:MAG: ATP phosphoribosyltransferase [Clostridia bacterium]|nr:ATP phosphoribosyltransferase [Clostridia bacterium]
MINVALPKGRLGEKVLNIFEQCGYDCPSIHETNRKLIFENEEAGVRYFWVKPSDVSIYVERGAADIGVAGKDILLEYAPDVYELYQRGVQPDRPQENLEDCGVGVRLPHHTARRQTWRQD